MTSSLVGSEMCIRDRQSPKQPDSPGEPVAQPHTAVRGEGGQEERGIQTPVSYTHLTLPTICSV
eukprot:10569134-Prorocentrum_lima.AAC.1